MTIWEKLFWRSMGACAVLLVGSIVALVVYATVGLIGGWLH